eukprot:TRINITY_DN18835_c0_g1_i1.p2 TRINITY_DN18835_c0_g1~~TRINITY_DN18835_c0_g1_i1.p2  ORF type:complete len:123 (+),score=22.96 TRINITY_DN18835_c0_g1_i1:108-476(+)
MSWNIPLPKSEQGIAIPGRDGEYLDPRSLSTTPGGTIFGTTPGGTRIVYDRAALMALASSPLAKTPPSGMPHIPGVTIGSPGSQSQSASPANGAPKESAKSPRSTSPRRENGGDDSMFSMDV